MTRIKQTDLQPLTPSELQTIRQLWQSKTSRSSRPTLKDIGERFNRSHHTIRNILRKKNYRHESNYQDTH